MTGLKPEPLSFVHLDSTIDAWNTEGLRGVQLLVVLAICTFVRDEPPWFAFPSIATLAERAGLNEKTVRKAITALESEGFITLERRTKRPSMIYLKLASTPNSGSRSVDATTPKSGANYSQKWVSTTPKSGSRTNRNKRTNSEGIENSYASLVPQGQEWLKR